jgi:hypothetical protein
MNPLKHPLEALHGETVSEQKLRFKKALAVIEPHMDRFYSCATIRRIPRTKSHVRNVKQVGVVDWEVLRYWAQEYLPLDMTPSAWKEKEAVA